MDENSTIKDIDSYNLLSNTEYHQISPFLHNFKQVIQKKFPYINEEVFFKSQEQCMKNLCRTMLYVDFLKNSNPPDYYLVKGISLAFQFYTPNSLRSFNDLDIFIKHDDYHNWKNFLIENNFKKFGNATDKFPDEIIKKYNFAQHFINEDNNIALDLHLNISNKMHPFQFDMNDFYSNSLQIDINGLKITTFQNEYTIIYLLYHCFKHYYFKAIWFIDLYKIFLSKVYDEKKVFQLIQKYKLQKLLNFYINIAIDLFDDSGIEKNSILLKNYTDFKNPIINSDNILKGEFRTENSLNRLLLPLHYLPKNSLKIRYLIHQLFPPMEIIPEFHEKKYNKNFINYLKFRLNRITRLSKTE